MLKVPSACRPCVLTLFLPPSHSLGQDIEHLWVSASLLGKREHHVSTTVAMKTRQCQAQALRVASSSTLWVPLIPRLAHSLLTREQWSTCVRNFATCGRGWRAGHPSKASQATLRQEGPFTPPCHTRQHTSPRT